MDDRIYRESNSLHKNNRLFSILTFPIDTRHPFKSLLVCWAVNFDSQKKVHHTDNAKKIFQKSLIHQKFNKKAREKEIFYLFSCSEHEEFKCLVTYGNFVSIQQKKYTSKRLIDISIVLQADFWVRKYDYWFANAFLWTLNWILLFAGLLVVSMLDFELELGHFFTKHVLKSEQRSHLRSMNSTFFSSRACWPVHCIFFKRIANCKLLLKFETCF